METLWERTSGDPVDRRGQLGQPDGARGAVHERALPRPAGRQPPVLQLAVGLQHRVRVDGERADDVLHGRELVTLAQHPQAQGVPYLLHDLQVRELVIADFTGTAVHDDRVGLGVARCCC